MLLLFIINIYVTVLICLFAYYVYYGRRCMLVFAPAGAAGLAFARLRLVDLTGRVVRLTLGCCHKKACWDDWPFSRWLGQKTWRPFTSARAV